MAGEPFYKPKRKECVMRLTPLINNVDKTLCIAIMAVFFFMLAGGGTGLAALDITDTNIEIAVDDALMQDQAVPSYLVDVDCANGVVTLPGNVDNILSQILRYTI